MSPLPGPSLQFTLKVASRCNLACTYCYVYETGDDSWRQRPGLMSEEVFAATVDRMREHCNLVGQKRVDVVFHGGEPCLLGPDRFARWCATLRARLADVGPVSLSIQTNGTLVDANWARIFRDYDVTVGVSIDGPSSVNDALRVDHAGRGSHERILAGIAEIRDAGLPINFLSVVQLGQAPLVVHEHLLSLGAASITYLMPDHTHETIGAVRRKFGPTPCADFLGPILDHWMAHDPVAMTVQPFKAMARVVLGGVARVDFLGNHPYRYVFIESDGTIEGLDVLRVCQPGLSRTGLNVIRHKFIDIVARSPLHRQIIFDGMPLPNGCTACPEALTCGGGYVPHRWNGRSFDNRSAWCEDLLALFARVREHLEVPPGETVLRRMTLDALRSEATAQCT